MVARDCVVPVSSLLTVTDAPTAGFTYAGPYCQTGGVPLPTLDAGATSGTYTATPSGLTLNGATGAITLVTSTPGTYTVTNTVAAAGGCAASGFQGSCRKDPVCHQHHPAA